MTSPIGVDDAAIGGNGILFISFNQDYTNLAVGANSGFTLLDIGSLSSLEIIYDNEGDTKDVHIIDRLNSSSLLATVSMTAPTLLKMCHFKNRTEITTRKYLHQILAVRMVRQRLVVVFEDELLIHNLKDMKVLHTIRDTPLNPKGICALSSSNDNSYMAYPGSSLTGDVQIFDLINLKAVASITAHNGPLACLAFDLSGTKLATASVKGTVIRVFSVPDGQPLFDLRRGLKRCVEISCLSFSADSHYLCVSSNTETVHIFKLVETAEKDVSTADVEGGSWMGYFNKVYSASVNYLPSQVSSVLNQDRAFATAKLPVMGMKSLCAIVTIQKVQFLVVACYNGYVYYYGVDSKNGGICELRHQHCIIPGMFAKKDHLSSGSSSSFRDLESEGGRSTGDTLRKDPDSRKEFSSDADSG